MCKYCEPCFADPNSDDSMPVFIGDDVVVTDKGHKLARISVHFGLSNSIKNLNSNKTTRITVDLHECGEGETLAGVDIPVSYCPFCGEKLPTLNQ